MITTTDNFITCDNSTLIQQIDFWNVAATSGGKIIRRDTGITLPVRYGYSVTVDLNANDTYTVRRIFKRGTKVFIKGEYPTVYADEVGETVYRAGCYLDDFGN